MDSFRNWFLQLRNENPERRHLVGGSDSNVTDTEAPDLNNNKSTASTPYQPKIQHLSRVVQSKVQNLFNKRGKIEDDEDEEEKDAFIDSEKLKRWISKSADKRQKFTTRAKYYIPIFQWLPKYKWRKNLVNDLIAGITVGVMLVPQCLAYANLIGLPSVFGLQTAFFSLIIYFFLGTSMQLSMGPEAVVSILTADSISKIIATTNGNDSLPDDLVQHQKQTLSCLITFFVGLFSFALGIFRFGFLAHVLSRALLAGFINAVAIEVILEQMDKFFGIDLAEVHSYGKIPKIVEHIVETNLPTLILGIGALTILLLLRFLKNKFSHVKLLKYVPDPLVVVVLGEILTYTLKLNNRGVAILGRTSAGFLAPSWFLRNYSLVSSAASTALTIAIIGMVESILVANTYATKHNQRISPNRELVAIGASNLGSSFFGSFPAFGSLTRSSVSDKAGCKTPIASLVTSFIVLMTILVLLPAFQYLPKVVMASIIVNAAIGLFEIHDLIFLWKVRAWKDLSLAASTFLITLILGVEIGITISIVISLFMVIKETSMPHVAILKQDPETNKFQEFTLIRDINLFEEKHVWFTHDFASDKGILIIRIEEPLYFANIGQVKELFQKMEQRGTAILNAIIFDASNIPHIDACALQILMEMVEDWKNRSIMVCFVKLRNNIQSLFFKSGLLDTIGVDRIFSKRNEAVQYVLGNKIESYSTYQT